MSGLVSWTSRAKRKAKNKTAGSKPNAQRQRTLAARKRKIKASALKAQARQRRAELAAE